MILSPSGKPTKTGTKTTNNYYYKSTDKNKNESDLNDTVYSFATECLKRIPQQAIVSVEAMTGGFRLSYTAQTNATAAQIEQTKKLSNTLKAIQIIQNYVQSVIEMETGISPSTQTTVAVGTVDAAKKVLDAPGALADKIKKEMDTLKKIAWGVAAVLGAFILFEGHETVKGFREPLTEGLKTATDEGKKLSQAVRGKLKGK